MLTFDQKKTFLNEVRNRKSILYGNFDKITDSIKAKKKAWVEIHSIMVSLGYTKSVEYLRDAEFKNLRMGTMVSLSTY